jgi:signal transduction histidine kinase
MFVFIWGATALMIRAVHRERAVARLQSDFVAAVSHEFRSPLTTVRQMGEMLEMGRPSDEPGRQLYYRSIVNEAMRLQRLIETLLNFGRLEAGTEHLDMVDVDVAAVIEAAVSGAAPEAGHRETTIDVGEPPRARVRADRDALSLALRNLIENAIKYSPPRSVVRVRCGLNESRVGFAVSDEGAGISLVEQGMIFRKFVRGQAARDGRVKGTGIGLALVRRVVAAHGGTVDLDSEIGRGSTFTIWVPVAGLQRS